LDGPSVPAVGFAFGMERLLLALESVKKEEMKPFIHCFMVALGESVQMNALKIVNDLRLGGLVCDYDFFNKNLKGKFKQSERLNPLFTLIYGEDEAKDQVMTVKVTSTGVQQRVPLNNLYNYLVNALRTPNSGGCAGECESCDEC